MRFYPFYPLLIFWVKRSTFSSPDSDDTFGADEQEEEYSMRDDQFLVSDRTENKFYGSLHGAGSAASTGGVVGSTVGPSLGYIGRRLQVRQEFWFGFGF